MKIASFAPGLRLRIFAGKAVTCGAAIDVPSLDENNPPGTEDTASGVVEWAVKRLSGAEVCAISGFVSHSGKAMRTVMAAADFAKAMP